MNACLDKAVLETLAASTLEGEERARLEAVVDVIDELESGIAESTELLQMVEEEQDNSMLDEVRQDIGRHNSQIEDLEFPARAPVVVVAQQLEPHHRVEIFRIGPIIRDIDNAAFFNETAVYGPIEALGLVCGSDQQAIAFAADDFHVDAGFKLNLAAYLGAVFSDTHGGGGACHDR